MHQSVTQSLAHVVGNRSWTVHCNLLNRSFLPTPLPFFDHEILSSPQHQLQHWSAQTIHGNMSEANSSPRVETNFFRDQRICAASAVPAKSEGVEMSVVCVVLGFVVIFWKVLLVCWDLSKLNGRVLKGASNATKHQKTRLRSKLAEAKMKVNVTELLTHASLDRKEAATTVSSTRPCIQELALSTKADFAVDTRWFEAPFVLSVSDQHSIHTSQFVDSKFMIDSLGIEELNGPKVSIDRKTDTRLSALHREAGTDIDNLRTDDPSLELHLCAFESPNLDLSSIRSNAIVLKFGAFVSDEVESRFCLRKVIDFQPTLPLALQKLKPAFTGSTNFSNALYEVRWTEETIAGQRKISLSWESEFMVSFGHGFLRSIQSSASDPATKLRSLAILKSKMDEGTFRIMVLVDWSAELECRYSSRPFASDCVNPPRLLWLSRSLLEIRPFNFSQRKAGLFLSNSPASQLKLRNSIVHHLADYGTHLSDIKSLKKQSEASQRLWEALNALSLKPPSDISGVRALFTTIDQLSDSAIQRFQPTVVIFDDTKELQDHWDFAICGLFAETIRKVLLLGNHKGCSSRVSSGEWNHLREQYNLSTIDRLVETGIQPMSLKRNIIHMARYLTCQCD
ncbi:hypothetical protein BKA65DRAFT_596175 [Rhexocercosporidium sp. MPI-PUGE-AT-0058]|nr:hypothetical protein BKA65DRAFT_596175 [Rhexocercosporidium sp. MPI-PUGE-AT-0058]